MKQAEDTLTFELPGATKPGRPVKFGAPMSAAQRQAKARQDREIRRAAAADNLRTIVYEVRRLRHAIGDGRPVEELQELAKGIEEAATGTMMVLGLE